MDPTTLLTFTIALTIAAANLHGLALAAALAWQAGKI